MGRTEKDGQERTRRRFARRQWARRWLTWRYVAAVVALVLLLGGGVYTVYFSSPLQVHGVDVTGTRLLADDVVRETADVPTGGPLATADLDAIARRVRSLATVESVEVSRQWPDEVLVRITERTPVALVEMGGQRRFVDADGVAFGTPGEGEQGLPRIETSGADTAALRESAAVAAALPDTVARRVDHVEVATIDQVVLVLRDGRSVQWGSAEASAEKGEVLAAMLAAPRTRDARIFDVSVPGSPTTRD